MKDMWIGFMLVMLTTFVCFGLVFGQIADIRGGVWKNRRDALGNRETHGEDCRNGWASRRTASTSYPKVEWGIPIIELSP